VVWDWIILGLTFYTVVMVPYNLAIKSSYATSADFGNDITLLVVDSIVDVVFFIDIIFNFHTTFVGADGSVIVEEDKIRQNYLRSGRAMNNKELIVRLLLSFPTAGFVIDIMACLPYDALNIFDSSLSGNREEGATGYGNVFSILKVNERG